MEEKENRHTGAGQASGGAQSSGTDRGPSPEAAAPGAPELPGSDGRGTVVRQVVLTAIAFGCLLGFSRALAAGFAGAAFVNSAPVAGLVDGACSWARFVALIGLTALGCARHSIINRTTVCVSGVAMAVCALVRSVVPAVGVQVAMSVLVGIASAFVMFALMLLLSSRSLKQLVGASIGGFAVGGAAIGALSVVPGVPGLVVLALSGLLPSFLMLGADRRLECCEEQGDLSRSELSRFPWFSSILLAATGVLGSVLYGVATTVPWCPPGQADYAVMVIAALAVIASTAAVILLQDNWVHTVWVPYLVLLAFALAFLCTGGQTIGPFAMGLLFALVMSYHFLRWMVFPAIVSTSLLPRVLTNGIFLVLTNSIFNVDMGVALATVLPQGLRTPAGMGGTVSLVLAVIFAIVMFVERLNRHTDDEVYVEGAEAEPKAEAGSKAEPEPEPEREIPLTIEQRCEILAEGKGLTTRENQIFSWTARGYSSAAIAEKLYISSSTVRFHQRNLYGKLGVHSKQELIQLVSEL